LTGAPRRSASSRRRCFWKTPAQGGAHLEETRGELVGVVRALELEQGEHPIEAGGDGLDLGGLLGIVDRARGEDEHELAVLLVEAAKEHGLGALGLLLPRHPELAVEPGEIVELAAEERLHLGRVVIELEHRVEVALEHLPVVVAVKALAALAGVREPGLEPVAEEAVDLVVPEGVDRADTLVPALVELLPLELPLVDLAEEFALRIS
jgi:hypothetical protein